MHKNYQIWTPVKIKTNNSLDRPTKFRAGQVWRCKIGENIGVEMDGKGDSFLRPVLILKRYGNDAFLGVPLTSQVKPPRPFYYPIHIGGRNGLVIISQLRFWDATRLTSFVDKLEPTEFKSIKNHIAAYLGLK